MKSFKHIFISFLIVAPLQSQEINYSWPTDASQYLTSSFGEYRARRFHAGIDVRTFGKVGFKCFAVRPGYVWRISASPNGYGKSVYLKLDTGEIAVYAHLSKYNDKIQSIVQKEQERTGKYRVNIFLKPDQLPVQQDEIIALTGQTGIGAPHLHFEIRDSGNRPTNPLLKNYDLPDNVSPIVRQISFTPLDGRSEVNNDFQPIAITPEWIRGGVYQIKEPVVMNGNIGIGVRAYDKAGARSGRYGVYRLELFVNNRLWFNYQYDRTTFAQNPMVELEREYLLSRRKLGRFYKLYKDKHNTLNHYTPNTKFAGVLKSAKLTTNLTSTNRQTEELAGAGSLLPGLYDIRIVVSDFFKNSSSITCQAQIGDPFEIKPLLNKDQEGNLALSDILTYDLNKIEHLEARLYAAQKWRPIEMEWPPDTNAISEKGGVSDLETDDESAVNNTILRLPHGLKKGILHFAARDQFGTQSRPFYHIIDTSGADMTAPEFKINYDFYEDYLRVHLQSNQTIVTVPKLTIYPGRPDVMEIRLHAKSPTEFAGSFGLSGLTGSHHPVELTVGNSSGNSYKMQSSFRARKVNSGISDRVHSDDKELWVNFWSNSLYEPIYTRVAVDSGVKLTDLEAVTKVYQVEPSDVLLKKGAFVHMKYPDSTSKPEQLGLYYQTGSGKWVFIDNSLDTGSKSVSAKVLSFEKFVLIRDDTPPTISQIRPGHNTQTNNTYPQFSAVIKDELSGIGSESDVEIRLDGKSLICEYDPERKRLFHQPDKPLAAGRHDIMVIAVDKSRNISMKKSSFWIN